MDSSYILCPFWDIGTIVYSISVVEKWIIYHYDNYLPRVECDTYYHSERQTYFHRW